MAIQDRLKFTEGDLPRHLHVYLLMVVCAVSINPQFVPNHTARPWLPLEPSYMHSQDLGPDEALVQEGEPVVLRRREAERQGEDAGWDVLNKPNQCPGRGHTQPVT